MSTPRAPAISWVLAVVLVGALGVGAAASILVSASTTTSAPASSASLVILPAWVLAAAAGALEFAILASLIYQRLTRGTSQGLSQYMVGVLVVILLLTVFVVGSRLIGLGGPVENGKTVPPSSGNGTAAHANQSHYLNSSGGSIVLFPSLPGWLPFALLALVVLVGALVAVPRVLRYTSQRGPRRARTRPGTAGPQAVRTALTRASRHLAQGDDPRGVILALYAELLDALEPIAGDLASRTPEEIRVDHLLRLQVRSNAAEALTRLFEEARYSAHAMGPSAAADASTAIHAALDDLSRRSFAA